jgi:hypothetical protein
VIDGSIPNNKSDLTRFYVGNEKVGAKDFLYLAWERVQEPSGTTNMDFEFNQVRTPSGNGVTPTRTAGDVLIKYDLSQGGTTPVLGYHRWVTSGVGSQVCEASNSVPCWGKVQNLSGNFEGAINTEATTDPLLIPPQTNPRTLSARTFGEASINLTDSAILNPNVCTTFGSAYLKSRSSDSFTAALKDFIAPIDVDISNCGNINVEKKDSATGAFLAGATFTLLNDVAPLGGAPGVEDTATGKTCTTDATGKCSFSNIAFGNYWVVETTAPPGYTAAAPQTVALGAGNSPVTVTFLDVQQKGSVTIVKTDDALNAMVGVKFTLTGTSNLGETVNRECTTAMVGNDATCTIANVPLGTYTLDEDASTLPAGYSKDPSLPKSVVVSTNGQTVTVNVANPRTHRVITIVCHEGTDSLFSVSVDGPGGSKTSIGAVPAALAAKTVTPTDLCGIGGAAFGGLGHGDVALTAHLAH